MAKPCPSCAEPASGRYCPHCGVAIEATCRECGHELPAGARFCNECGAPVAVTGAPAERAAKPPSAESPRPAASKLPWAIAAAAVIALAGVVFLPRLGEDDEATAVGPPITAPASVEASGARGVDLASMTPREAADRLFNRVMQSVSEGDTTEARQFLPMALGAYGRVEDLDIDGRYHVAVLHFVDSDPEAARAQAEAILNEDPNHLFGLFTAAQAAQALGNRDRARELYQQFLDRYETEIDRGLPEYSEHAPVLPSMLAEAQRAVEA